MFTNLICRVRKHYNVVVIIRLIYLSNNLLEEKYFPLSFLSFLLISIIFVNCYFEH